MTTFWTWLSIIGLSMTPNLILGPSAAVGVGIAAHYDPWVLLPVVTVAGYFEGLVVAWLAGESTHIGFIGRWVARCARRGAAALADKWGVWGGLTLRLRPGRTGTDPGGAALAGYRHAPNLAAAGSQRRGLCDHLLCGRMVRLRPGGTPLTQPRIINRTDRRQIVLSNLPVNSQSPASRYSTSTENTWKGTLWTFQYQSSGKLSPL